MLSQSIQVLRRTNKHRISCFNQDMVLISSKQKMMYIYHVYIYNWHYIHIYMMYIYIHIYHVNDVIIYIYIPTIFGKILFPPLLQLIFIDEIPIHFEVSSGLRESATCRAMTHMCRSQDLGDHHDAPGHGDYHWGAWMIMG